MSIFEWFSNFSSNIKISDESMQSIRARRDSIARRINIDFWGTDSTTNHRLFGGSFGRGTKTHFSDIDLLVVLPNKTYDKYNAYLGNGQSALLQALKTSIQKTYSTSHLSGDGQVVALNFTDGIGFEIVPVFENKDGHSFTYPDSNNGGSWKVTDPRSEIQAISDMNDECNGNVKRFAQMIREWKYANNVDIPGILIDVFVFNFMKDYEYKDKSFLYYDFFSRDFFNYLSEIPSTQEKFQIMGSGKYITFDGFFQYKAKQAYNNARKAIEYLNNERKYSAQAAWRDIYGSKF